MQRNLLTHSVDSTEPSHNSDSALIKPWFFIPGLSWVHCVIAVGKTDLKFICWFYCARQSSLLHLCQPKMFSHPKVWLSCSVPLQSSYLEHKQSHELLFVLCPAVTKCIYEGKGENLGWPNNLNVAGLQLLRFLKHDEYPNLESIKKELSSKGKKNKPKSASSSKVLKFCTAWPAPSMGSAGPHSWNPVSPCHYWSAVCQGKEELKLSKAMVYQANQQCAAYLHVKRSTCRPPNHFKCVWRSFHSTCLHLFCLCLCFSLPLRNAQGSVMDYMEVEG